MAINTRLIGNLGSGGAFVVNFEGAGSRQLFVGRPGEYYAIGDYEISSSFDVYSFSIGGNRPTKFTPIGPGPIEVNYRGNNAKAKVAALLIPVETNA